MCTFVVSNLTNIYPPALRLFTQNTHTPNLNCSSGDEPKGGLSGFQEWPRDGFRAPGGSVRHRCGALAARSHGHFWILPGTGSGGIELSGRYGGARRGSRTRQPVGSAIDENGELEHEAE